MSDRVNENLPRRKATSEFSRSEYRKSWRAQRRAVFMRQRQAVRDCAPPPLLGPRTDIMTVIAASGPLRCAVLQELFSDMRLGQARSNVDSGAIVAWKLPGSDKRGQRGVALALDPTHPLHHVIRELLLVLAKTFPFRLENYMTASESTIPKSERDHDIDEVLFSLNRLRVLATLEALGDSANLASLLGSVPGIRRAVVEQTVRILLKDGVAVKNGPVVSYAPQPWTDALRNLIKAYLRLRPEVQGEIAARVDAKQVFTERGRCNTLFGREVVARILQVLATDGPLSYSEVQVRSQMVLVPNAIKALLRDGVLTRKSVPGFRHSKYLLGFNADHPLYRETVALHASLAGAAPSEKPPLSGPYQLLNIYRLFTSPHYANVLLTLHTAVNGEIGPTTIFRMHPRHCDLNMRAVLRRWAEQQVVLKHHFGNVVLYGFNPDYPHYRPLGELLDAICKLEPRYRTLAELEPDLYIGPVQGRAHAQRRAEEVNDRRPIILRNK